MGGGRGSTATSEGPAALRFHGVRYQVADVARSVEFYSRHLGFRVERQSLPAFASLTLGPLDLLLSGPAASGSRPLPDGRVQGPGGWNRIVLRVENLPSWIDAIAASIRAVKADQESLRLQNEFFERSKHPLDTPQ